MGWLLLALSASASATSAPQRTILVLGDSLSAAHNMPAAAGWVHLLDARVGKMVPKWRVVNASISGETSLSGRNRLPELLKRERPAVLILELGANDGLRGLPLPALRENLVAMLDQARAAHVLVLLVGIELPVNYGPRYRDGLRAVYAELAQQRQLPLVPFLLEGITQDPALMQADGLHPAAQAQSRVLQTVWPKLQPLLGSR